MLFSPDYWLVKEMVKLFLCSEKMSTNITAHIQNALNCDTLNYLLSPNVSVKLVVSV